MKREKKQQRWTWSIIVLLAMLLVPKTAWAVNGTLTTRTVAGKTYYEIADSKDLVAFRNLVNDLCPLNATSKDNAAVVSFANNYNAILVADFTFDSSLTLNSIGIQDNATAYFAATFDGNGHTITGLKVTPIWVNGTAFYGLFCHTRYATIKDLYLKDVSFSQHGAYNYHGVLAKLNFNSTFSNVYIEGKITVSEYTGQCGALVGSSSACNFTNCGVNCEFDMSGEYSDTAAGLSYSVSDNTTFTNCYYYGSVTS